MEGTYSAEGPSYCPPWSISTLTPSHAAYLQLPDNDHGCQRHSDSPIPESQGKLWHGTLAKGLSTTLLDLVLTAEATAGFFFLAFTQSQIRSGLSAFAASIRSLIIVSHLGVSPKNNLPHWISHWHLLLRVTQTHTSTSATTLKVGVGSSANPSCDDDPRYHPGHPQPSPLLLSLPTRWLLDEATISPSPHPISTLIPAPWPGLLCLSFLYLCSQRLWHLGPADPGETALPGLAVS